MNQRDREIVKLALLYLQSQLVDFCDQLEQDEPEDPITFNGIECEPPRAAEIEAVINQFQDVL